MPETAAAVGGLIGVSGPTITGIAEAIGLGAGTGGLVGDITGGTKGLVKGLEAGALTGAGAGVGGAALGGFGGSAIGGAVGGAAGSEVTGGNPLTGALEGGIGSGISSAIGGTTNILGTANPGSGAATGTPIGGTGGGASTAAPAGVGSGGGGDVTAGTDVSTNPNTFSAVDNSTIGNPNPTSTANTGGSSGAPASSSNVAQTTGTPSVTAPSGSTPFTTAAGSANTGSAPTDNLVNGFSASQAASAPVTDALPPNVIAASNAASPGGTDVSLNQPGVFQNITGSEAPIPQSGSSVGSAASGVAGAGAPNTIATAFNNPSLSNIASALGANSGALLSGAGLLGDVALNHQSLKGEKELSNEAGSLAAQGQSLQKYLQTGTLPAGLQGALDSASENAIATIKSQYAAHGMSGSSAEQDAIANVQSQVASQGSQMALQLLQTGVSESQGASQLYEAIMNNALSQDNELGSAIGRFATAAAGGTPQTTISVGGKNVTV